MEKDLQYYKDICSELEAIFEMAFDQITVADGNGIFLRASKACGLNFGLPNEEIVGSSAYDFERKGIFDKSVTVAVLEKKREVTIAQTTAGNRKLLVTGKPIFDETGNIKRVINISKDITEIENLKEELKNKEELVKTVRDQLRHQNGNQEILIGSSTKMQEVVRLMEHIAPFQTTILLQGETGVGKSMFARFIHNNSLHKEMPFIQINCGAIPEELLESELFGYVPGAFTGALREGKEGLLESAGEGTVFLDEISELPLHLQVKLLHVLQEREIMRVGGTKPVKINARIIVAANKDLKDMVKQEKFRGDLYYRISVVPIHIPALREREEDIIQYIRFFLKIMNGRYGMAKDITYEATALLRRYEWPGNVREMENVIERLVVSTFHDTISEVDVRKMMPALKREENEAADTGDMSLTERLNQVERSILEEYHSMYKTTRAIADKLGIDQSTVVKKLKKYDIK